MHIHFILNINSITEYLIFRTLQPELSENYSKVISNFYGNHEGINLAGFTQLEANPVPKIENVCRITY